MKILIIDIETKPNLAWVWGLWNQNIGINQINEVGTVFSFAAKWHNEKTIYFASDHHDGHQTMIEKAWQLVDDADAIVHYNGKAFDMKHLYREFLLCHLDPPSPHTDIDLLHTVKRRFKFSSNKLQFVSEQLGLAGKVQHDGFDLWKRCMEGDDKAWNIMRRYNKQDVVLTEQVYNKLLPWIPNHPNRAVIDNKPNACPRCLSTTFHARGFRHTQTSTYRRYQCNDCRSYFQDKSLIPTATKFKS